MTRVNARQRKHRLEDIHGHLEFEAGLRRDGLEVVYGGQKAGFAEEEHAHGFDVRIFVLGGEITLTRDGGSQTFRAGEHCEIAGTCQHTTKVGPEGVAYLVGRVTELGR